MPPCSVVTKWSQECEIGNEECFDAPTVQAAHCNISIIKHLYICNAYYACIMHNAYMYIHKCILCMELVTSGQYRLFEPGGHKSCGFNSSVVRGHHPKNVNQEMKNALALTLSSRKIVHLAIFWNFFREWKIQDMATMLQ